MRNIQKTIGLAVATMALVLGATTALAIDNGGPIDAAITAGRVGEQADGYLGFVNPPTTAEADLVRRVNDVNIRRRAVYTDVATRVSDTVERTALLQALRQIERTENGTYFRDLSGTWCRKSPNARVAQATDGTITIACQ